MPTATLTTKEEIRAELSCRIHRFLDEFQLHSLTCRPCRNPIRTYEARQQLCEYGAMLSGKITELMYKKAEYHKSGYFELTVPLCDQAANGIILMITHNKQGAYGNKVLDLKRARPQSEITQPTQRRRIENSEPRYIPTPAPDSRGSGYAEDQQRLARRELRDPGHTNTRDYSTYGNPNTSYREIQNYTQQASSSNGDTHSDSRLSSGQRSVKFDRKVQVREFEA